MLGLHRTPKGLERKTYEQKVAKMAVTRELVGKVIISSYNTHQKVVLLNICNDSGVLAIEIEVPLRFQIDDSAPLPPVFTRLGARLGGKLMKIKKRLEVGF